MAEEFDVNSILGTIPTPKVLQADLPLTDSHVVVEGARVHNLKNISLAIPRHALTVVTGLSGSGKSSLAFDVIYAEGQRRYMETLSGYARQFIGTLEKPDVDYVGGLAPVIAIEQRTTGRNRRSTVGTITEIYDFLRLLYAKVGIAYSPATGKPLQQHSDEEIAQLIMQRFSGKTIALCAPLVRGRKGEYDALFKSWSRKGFVLMRIDGVMREITPGMKLNRYNTHTIELVVDRLQVDMEERDRLGESIKQAMNLGEGALLVVVISEKGDTAYFSRKLMCPESGFALDSPETHTFSFNSPYGYCPFCYGLGYQDVFAPESVLVNRNASLLKGGLKLPLSDKGDAKEVLSILEAYMRKIGVKNEEKIKDIDPEKLQLLLWGEPGANEDTTPFTFKQSKGAFMGLLPMLYWMYLYGYPVEEESLDNIQSIECPHCHGTRLKPEALAFKVAGLNIGEASALPLDRFYEWAVGITGQLSGSALAVASEVCKEIVVRTQFLLEVGLEYLSLSRAADSLSGGESQRIRLATQIGTKLVNVLYILDEPSIGLHPRDNVKLIESLKKLRDIGNTVVVVEHDEEMMRAADHLVDLGPGAGRNGGNIVAQGSIDQILKSHSLTAKYLNGEQAIAIPSTRRKGNGSKLVLKGASGNNLKNVTLTLPLGTFICITGVSGSGKSSLINGTLQPLLSKHLYRSFAEPLPYQSIEGLENIDKVIEVDQSPLGRTPRSNPATYTNLFTDIRSLFAETPESKIRGYKPGRFSFNVKGGRCEHCKGAGVEVIEMNFLPDVHVVCSQCRGQRYNRETLAVRYKGKNINDVLEMTVNMAAEFFEHHPKIHRKLEAIQSVGMGYIKLGQPCTTLSGGESQRVKLATELCKRASGKTIYILDEPTTGLHFEDIRLLLQVLHALVDKGNTVVVIEHNLDVVKTADYIVDLGPESGEKGGMIIAQGTPEKLVSNGIGYTAEYLGEVLGK